MDDYISRKDAVEWFMAFIHMDENAISADTVVTDLKNAIPAADVVPVRHGRWIKRGYVCGENEYECSECHETEWRTSDSRMEWCMFCGAKMDGGPDNGKMGRI